MKYGILTFLPCIDERLPTYPSQVLRSEMGQSGGSVLPKMSKSFTENFVHGDEAILREKWLFWPLILLSSDEKPVRRRPKFAHKPCFCARFLLKFCYFSRFCKHAKFSKVNAKFFCGVDFFFLSESRFLRILNQSTDRQILSKPSKNRRFFVQKLFSWRILEIWRPKIAILSILFKNIGVR